MPRQYDRRTRPIPLAALVACAVLYLAQLAWAQPPHAIEPLPTPYFSIDRASPTVGPAVRPGDVLDKPGPSPAFSAQSLGLVSPLDDLDGLSGAREGLLPDTTFAILFSVDRASVGGVPPDPALVAMNRPFNVQDQAARGQAAGDLFMSTLLFNMSGPISPGPFRGPGGNNTSVINQGDTGGVDYDLKPNKSSMTDTQNEPLDELDAVSEKDGQFGPARGGPGFGPGTGVPGPGLFFSASRQSPSLDQLPGSPSGANIYYVAEPGLPGTTTLFAPAQVLGLQPGLAGDDITDFVVFDNGDRVFTTGSDFILFTLARGSPSLGSAFSSADVFASTGGSFFRYAPAAALGLSPTDHIDALELLATDDIDDAIFRHAILRVLPGDVDSDGQYTPIDCAGFESCFSGSGVSFDPNIATHVISVGPGPQFSPADIVIETGDIVQWIWADGPHNVVSGIDQFDGVFNSGTPTSVSGTSFTVAFNETLLNQFPHGGGHYPFFSEPNLSAGMTGTVTVVANPCATYDIDFDGDVDCEDWKLFRKAYAQSGVPICVMLTVEEFVAALLCQPIDPIHTCYADMNLDGVADGRDVRPYVDAYLSMP